MSRMLPSAVEQRWQEVLRRAAIALKGGGVGVWEADPGGRLRLLATSEGEGLAPVVADDLETTLPAAGWRAVSRGGAGASRRSDVTRRSRLPPASSGAAGNV